MSVTLIDRDRVKQHIRVTHDASNDLIDNLLKAAIDEAQNYLNKTWYLTPVDIDAAVTAGADRAKTVLLKESMNQAVALLVEFNYYGPSAIGAEKLEKTAYNLLHPDRYLVGW